MRESSLLLPDAESVADLVRFVRRATRLEADGAVRLVGAGPVLAVYACALAGSGGPTVLGLRTLTLAAPSAADVTVPLAAVGDRLARLGGSPEGPVALELPPVTAANAAWAGLLPPRAGWSLEGLLEPGLLRTAAAVGVAEVAAGTPEQAGGAAVARLRAAVWSRPLVEGSGLPAGVALAADALGFIGEEAISVHRAGRWWRLSLLRGHVLARPPSALT